MLKIKEIRKIKNISQDVLAEKTGISKRMLIDYERNLKDIPLQKLQLIANALETSISDLFIDVEYKLAHDNYNLVTEPTQNLLLDEKNLRISELQKNISDLQQTILDLRKDKELLTAIIEGRLKAS